MEKKVVSKEILHHNSDNQYTWGDIKNILAKENVELQDSDKIRIQYEEAYYSENNSYEAHYSLLIIRERFETDSEFEIRVKEEAMFNKQLKEKRRSQYLKLKKEFESETINQNGDTA